MRLILLLWAGGWVEYGRVFVGKEGLGERGEAFLVRSGL